MKIKEFVADQLGYKKPSFKDAEEGIDFSDLRIAGKILIEFKK